MMSGVINPLLTDSKLVWLNQLGIGLDLFSHVYDLNCILFYKQKISWPISIHLDLEHLVNNPYLLPSNAI